MRSEPVAAFWCRIPSRPNFGDALTPWLIRKLTGQYPVYRNACDQRPKIFVAGSIMEYATIGCTVWGSGIMSANDRIDPRAKLLAVRGPLTRERALECGADCGDVLGDPALLLPRFHPPAVPAGQDIGIAPHYSDHARIFAGRHAPPPFRIIDMQSPVEAVIDTIYRCRLVAASSLHGLITAHAYGIPATWIEFQPLPSGDRSKFVDYLLSIGCELSRPLVIVGDQLDPDLLAKHAIAPPHAGNPDIDLLLASCPFGSAG